MTGITAGPEMADLSPGMPDLCAPSLTYGSDGSSLTTTDDGCMMYSAPGYSYGDNLSFSSGC